MIIKDISHAFVQNMFVQLMRWYWIIPDKTKWITQLNCFLLWCALSNMSCKNYWIKQGRHFNQIGFCPAEIILGHVEISLPFAWLQNIEMAQVVDIILHWWQRSVYRMQLIPWMMIAWQRKGPGYQPFYALQWRHYGRDGVSNHQPHECWLSRLFRRRSMKTSKLRVTGLCAGNSPVTGEFLAQMASNAENVSIWWRHNYGRRYIPASGIFWAFLCSTPKRYM